MASIKQLFTHKDERGFLHSLEDFELGFGIKRVFYIHPNSGYIRGEHSNFHSKTAIICLNGSCHTQVISNGKKENYFLSKTNEYLILEPGEWRMLYDFSENCILLVISSENYDPMDFNPERKAKL